MTARGPEFQYYGQALQAAVDGLGVAMGIRPYIDDDLAAGRLVAPFALSVPKGMRWYLVYRSFQHRAARFRRVPALDHPRRGRARRAPQGPRKMLNAAKKKKSSKKAGNVNGFTFVLAGPCFPRS